MLKEELKKELIGIQIEIIDLNQTVFFFLRKVNRLAHIFRTTTRTYVLEEFQALRYLENGIILHLTKLDDDNSSHSFRKAKKLLNKIKTDKKELTVFQTKLDLYRKNLSDLKNNHRNMRIAHINSTEYPNIDEFLDFNKKLRPLLEQANEIADLLWGKRINVKFRLGSMEGVLDFRKENESLEFDVNKSEGFY
jgi:hypothetical protein